MSHHLYTTSGFVLGSMNTGEANKILHIFTRDLGLVIASAQGVRYLKSKLRYHLEKYNCLEVSLVRGKEMWRITGASECSDFLKIKEDKEVYMIYARILSLLKRLLNGEEKHSALFHTLIQGFSFLTQNPLSADEKNACEQIIVLRILRHLGYVEKNDSTEIFLNDRGYDMGLLNNAKDSRQVLVSMINKSIKATQL